MGVTSRGGAIAAPRVADWRRAVRALRAPHWWYFTPLPLVALVGDPAGDEHVALRFGAAMLAAALCLAYAYGLNGITDRAMDDNQANSVIHNAHRRKLIAPMALAVFVWIFLMNFMDMIPVDLLPSIWHVAGPAMGYPDYLRVVPTADLSTTLGLSFSVLVLCLFYNIKIKGLGGWTHELVTAPFGTSKNPFWALLLGVVNFLMQMIEFVAKTVSHGMRLFGNMFAGELVFMLIALLGAYAALSLGGGLFFVGHLIAGTVWTLFHILVITLQAFIFMMLALIYLGQAHDAH